MKIRVSEFSKTKDGDIVSIYSLKNQKGMVVNLLDYGAIIKDVLVRDKNKELVDVVLGFDTLAEYEVNKGALGAFIGRNANRIRDARVIIDGKLYELDKNKGEHNLHSGFDRSHFKIYEAELYEDDFISRVTFSRKFKDLEQGFPGNLDLSVSYTLTEDCTLIIDYCAISDKDTVMNFTNHSYFNLDGEETVLDSKLQIDADFFTETDEFQIPTGELVPVKGTPLDFKSEKRIGDEIESNSSYMEVSKGYDHNYVLNNNGELCKVASLSSEKSGIRLDVYTDLPGLQIYTANFLDGKGKNGRKNGRYSGICFETQYFPNACNEPKFKSSIVRAQEEFNSTTIFAFS